MKLKAVSGIMLALFLIGMLTPAFNFQQVKASGTIYIKADGSVDPPSAPISSVDNVTYTFTDNISDEIVVERSNIVVDGSGYTLVGGGSGIGINMTWRSNVTLKNVEVTNFDYGIYLNSSSNNTLSGNTVYLNIYGIYLNSSSNNVLTGNTVSNNDVGVCLSSSSDNTVSGNSITENGDGVRLEGYSNSNTVSGNNITNNTYEGVRLYLSSNNTVSENNITNSNYGVLLSSLSNDNSVSGNNITNSYYGVFLSSSSDNTVSGNTITNNDLGIYLGSSSNNTVSGNNITNNAYEGIYLGLSSNNTVSGNNITNDDLGVYFYSSSNNTVSGNTITNNWVNGIRLSNSSDNKFYHNNFINNTQQVYIQTSGYANFWDEGYPSGGNYWSDYDGTDLYHGPYQNETGSDGIGDTPYVIGENNTDRYPLVKPYGVLHDIGITSITPSRTIIGQGYSLHINIRIVNYGINAETFNVTAYANTTILIDTQLVTLARGNSTTVTFTWNTAGVSYGYYAISAEAGPVPGETDTDDNAYINGWVLVTVAGDVNLDGIVDIFDGVPVAAALGAKLITDPQDPRFGEYWHDETCPRCPHNPLADINQDGVIDGLDLMIVDNNYGKTW